MKNKVFILLLLLVFINVTAQEVPRIKIGEKEIAIQKIKVNAIVVGDIVFTTYDMRFYNPNNRILEGELFFPLGENQSVNRFALDINGHLRDAVVIEKEKARVAYESTIRRKIDPALLEKGKGNTYKARIYPIPAKGYKRVVIGVQQKLVLNNDAYFLKLPFNFENKLEEFSVTIEVLNQHKKPIVTKGMISKFEYNAKKDAFFAFVNSKKTKVVQPILVKIPLNTSKKRVIANKNYFYFSKKLNLNHTDGSLEKNITIFWDASLSQKNKKVISELALLDQYFTKAKNVEVKLVVFNTSIKQQKSFTIHNGNWQLLKNELEATVYDGGSSFNSLKLYKNTSKANLLFSDGMNTLDDFDLNFTKKTFIINSAISANHLILKNKAIRSGGDYINLSQLSTKQAFEKFTMHRVQFLGTSLKEANVEIYPKKGSVISERFYIVGKGNISEKTFKVYVGSGNKIKETIEVTIPEKEILNEQLSKIWAENKLKNLLADKENNRSEIIRLSKKHQIISPFTSMLILDRVEDYVQHEIIPPNELLDEYNRLIAQKVDNKKERLAVLQNRLFSTYEDFFDWYKKDFKIYEKKKIRDRRKSKKLGAVRVTDRIEVVEDDEVVEVEEIVMPSESVEEAPEEELQELAVSSIQRETIISENVKMLLSNKDSKERVPISKNKPVYVVDGRFVGENSNVKSEDIHSTYTISPKKAQAVYGKKASNGIIVIITKNGRIKNSETIKRFEQLVRDKTELKGWNPKTPYLDTLKKIVKVEEAYKTYLKLRETYGSSPSFYIDVADFFKKKGDNEKAIQVLTNVAEIDVDNYELLKALAYKFEAYELHEYAVFIYKEILKLRPEDIQSYRDLALAYECIDEHQKSIDILYQIINGELLEKDENRRFSGIEAIALVEFNRMIHLYENTLQTQHFDSKFIKPIKTDIRVLIDWNHNDTDIDLWVIDPNGEKCFYSHKRTKIGGLMSQDMTQGFGPEQFVLKKGMKGKYQLKVKYYSSSQQKISGPTFLKVTTFKKYGTKNEIKSTQLIRLKDVKEVLDLGSFFFDL